MNHVNHNEQNDFMIQRIKERPINKARLMKRTMLTISMALIFGIVASITFLGLQPFIQRWLFPEEQLPPVVFEEVTEEINPEDMLTDTMLAPDHNMEIDVTLEDEQIQQILLGVTLDLNHYKQLYRSMKEYLSELNQCIVTVTGIHSDVDWLNDIQERKNEASGLVIYNTTRELLVLTSYEPLKNVERIQVTFFNNLRLDGQLKQIDPVTNFAVIGIPLQGFSSEFLQNEHLIAKLGSSNYMNMEGIPVVALGRPMGVENSIGCGIITATSGQIIEKDVNFKLLQTNIAGSHNAKGVLFNLQGEVLGIISDNKGNLEVTETISAISISDLKKRIEKMSNEKEIAYFGIKGNHVSKEAHQEQGVPYGAYVQEVLINSPAMEAGIQKGDVIQYINDRIILSYSDFSSALENYVPNDTITITIGRLVQEEYKEMKLDVNLRKHD